MYFFFTLLYVVTKMHTQIKYSAWRNDLVAYLFINCFWAWCSHMMMHKDQTHIKRNCFSIGIISSKLQSGCYNYWRRRPKATIRTRCCPTRRGVRVHLKSLKHPLRAPWLVGRPRGPLPPLRPTAGSAVCSATSIQPSFVRKEFRPRIGQRNPLQLWY
jgi:hypothetical protein